MNMYEGKLIMYACIIRETFVFTVFRRVFHSILKLELCRHACRRRDQIIPTCRYGKNMPTTALLISLFEVWRAQKERACFSLGNELSRQKITQIEAPPHLLCPPYFKKAYSSPAQNKHNWMGRLYLVRQKRRKKYLFLDNFLGVYVWAAGFFFL